MRHNYQGSSWHSPGSSHHSPLTVTDPSIAIPDPNSENQQPAQNEPTKSSVGSSDLLHFNDNYSALLQNLTNENPNIIPQSFNNPPTDVPNQNQTNNNTSSGNDFSTEKQSLDTLLQHYQNLIGKPAVQNEAATTSATTKSSVTPPTNEPVCNYCRQKGTKCFMIPNLGKCIECETNRIQCFFPNSVKSNKRERVDNNNLQTQNGPKKIKQESVVNNGNNSPNHYYSDFLQTLNNTISTSASNLPMPNANLNMNINMGMNPSAQYNQVQTQPENVQSQLPVQYPRSSFYVGPTSVYDINLINHVKLDNIDQIQLSKSLALRKVATDVQFILRDDLNRELYLKQEQEVDVVETLIYPHGKLLIEIFFSLVHPYFPILHERVFLEKYARSYRELTAPLLAAIYSLALQWWDFHPKLIGFPKPDVVNKLNDIAFKSFFNRIERPKLSMVQTGLLILQCRSENRNNWVLSSVVVSLAEELGLGVDCQDWRLPKWEKDLRRRLAWAVWMEDKWMSLNEARHSHLILGRNWMVKPLQSDDFPPTSSMITNGGATENNNNSRKEPPSFIGTPQFDMSLTAEDYTNGTLIYHQMVSLSIILGEIMDTFYTQGAITVNTNIEQVLKLAKPLQLKLREWYHSLPSQISMSTFTPKRFIVNATLTLAYFAAEITLHRKIISTLRSDTPKELVHVCRQAAKTRLIAAIEFIRDLKNEHINAFWYTCSTSNLMLIGTFAALLYVTSPTKEESDMFRDCLRNYIWILRVGSKAFDKFGHALNNIHMLLTQIPGLLTDDLDHLKEAGAPKPFSHIPQSQHLKTASPAMTEQGSPSTLNQFKNMAPELLQNLTNIQATATTTTSVTPAVASNSEMTHTPTHLGSPSKKQPMPTSAGRRSRELDNNVDNQSPGGSTVTGSTTNNNNINNLPRKSSNHEESVFQSSRTSNPASQPNTPQIHKPSHVSPTSHNTGSDLNNLSMDLGAPLNQPESTASVIGAHDSPNRNNAFTIDKDGSAQEDGNNITENNNDPSSLDQK
ncbi:hypothetical protein NCAS_0C05100 [Naumovozyma castellii]|uniref:Xylanolytic transcriptional activator regulatory domain-containing protein n=1 Tax=Naumovozyma castellii TaxID=27288 RepID=G0VDD8_NAUCA|nr:hypothetical protein NCAS_0C05100 [Naumovozyma castellii CBS 4309]CCC69500.1 hypothetical protein NCAS_0C05100 [Naumovozyma castellii CBS 4309]